MKGTPDYRKIYSDILDKKFPDKKSKCQIILSKNRLSTLDVITLNKMIFGDRDNEAFILNQKHRSYSDEAIIEILEYQKKHNLNNTQCALKFRLSRNSITKWKRKHTTKES